MLNRSGEKDVPMVTVNTIHTLKN